MNAKRGDLRDSALFRLRGIALANPGSVLTYFGHRCGVVELSLRRDQVEHTRLLEYSDLVAAATGDRRPPRSGELESDSCTWCGQRFGHDTATITTARGSRHAFVFTKQDVDTGRRLAICLELAPGDFINEQALRVARRRAEVLRRQLIIRLELQGIAP